MSRRWRGVNPGRPSRWDPPWIAAIAPAAPDRSPDWLFRRRVQGWVRRRTGWFDPPWTTPAAVTPPPPTTISRVRRQPALVVRRGRHWDAPASVGVERGGWLRSRRPSVPARRGDRFDPPWVTQPLPDRIRSRRTRATIRRGRRFEPPWGQVVETAPMWIAPIVRAGLRLAGRPVRRGDRFDPPWGQAVQENPPWTSPQIRAARRPSVRPARGDRFEIAGLATAPMPQFRSRRRRLWWGGWRSRYWAVPFGTAGSVPRLLVRSRRRIGSYVIRGGRFDPPWTVVPQVQEGPPLWVRSKRRAAAWKVYGSRWNPPWAGLAGVIEQPNYSVLPPTVAGAVTTHSSAIVGETDLEGEDGVVGPQTVRSLSGEIT